MSRQFLQFKKICCNIVAWLLIWLVAVLAIPLGILLLLIYGIRAVSDRMIRRLDGSAAKL